jgi:hypothetical protein
MDELVEKYIKLRDKKAQIKARYDEEKAGIEGAMTKLENVLLLNFHKLGVESVKTPAGTAYMSTRTSCTIADWEEFAAFMDEHDRYDMQEKRVSKKVVEEYRQVNNALPPGLNWREEQTINIRR